MDGMVRREREVDGVLTSLCDLGYCEVGVDDGWQSCTLAPGVVPGTWPPTGSFHDDDGNPIIDTDKFPSLKSMMDHAHALNLTSGWYGNNCACQEAKDDELIYRGDVKALRTFGFDALKLDACGALLDTELYNDLLEATPATSGRDAVLVENCHWGESSKAPYKPNATWCPWHMYRTSMDLNPSYASVVRNLQTVIEYATSDLSRPGCWACIRRAARTLDKQVSSSRRQSDIDNPCGQILICSWLALTPACLLLRRQRQASVSRSNGPTSTPGPFRPRPSSCRTM